MTEIFIGKNIDEAKRNACAKFGAPIDKIKFEIIDEGKKGFLGIGKTDAKVKATYTPVKTDEKAEKTSANEKKNVATLIEKIVDGPVEEKAKAAKTEEKAAAEETKPAAEISEEIASEADVIEEAKPDEITDEEEEYSLDNFTLIENDADLNPKAKIAVDYIESVLSAMDVNAKFKIYQNEKGAVIDIDSDSNGTIIGRRGDTLDAIQYLSSMIANKGDREYFRITIDCFGYREKRKATLKQLAEKVAKSVLRTGRSQPLEPMNPYERRVIHSAISKIEGVASRSVGDEPYRKIIISSELGNKRNDRRRGGGRNGNRNGGRKNFEPRESKQIDLSTSFEKDYKRPKPEDNIEGGLYGKIEF